MSSIEIGKKVKVTCIDGDTYAGVLEEICIGVDPENPTQTSIIIEEKNIDGKDTLYGQIHIWCNSLKHIELLNN